MKRELIRLIKGVILICSLFIVYQYVDSEVRYTNIHHMGVEVIEPELYDELMAEREEVYMRSEHLLFGGEAVAYDKLTDTFYISQSMKTEEWKGQIEVADVDYKVYFLEDDMFKDKQYAIESAYEFPILLVSDENYMQGKIVFTGLPTVSLNGSANDSLSEIVVNYPDAENIANMVYASKCRFHVRGSASIGYKKKNFKISLYNENMEQEKTALLGMREDDDWVLNGLYTDSSKVREKVAYELWDDMNDLEEKPIRSSQMEYIELFINNRYHGLYGLTTPIDGKLLELDEGDVLYKIRRWELPDPANFDLCADITDLNNFDGGKLVSIKYPQSIVGGYEWDPLKVYVDEYMWAEEIEHYTNPSTPIIVDVENAVVYYWYYQMLYANDNGWKNIYLIAERQDDGTYRMYKTAWDLNYAFGDIWDEPIEELWTKFIMPREELLEMTDFERLKDENEPLINELSVQKWNQWKNADINATYIGDMADEYIEQLWASGAMTRDSQRWLECKHDKDASEIREWAEVQFRFLDTYINNLK